MAELRKMDYEKISVKCKDDQYKDYIPSNWYVSARKMWQVVAWCLIQIRNGTTIRDDKTVDHFIHKMWEYIEEYAVVVGKENEDGTEEGKSV